MGDTDKSVRFPRCAPAICPRAADQRFYPVRLIVGPAEPARTPAAGRAVLFALYGQVLATMVWVLPE